MKKIFLLKILLITFNTFSQTIPNIKGEVYERVHFNDTLIFTSGLINPIYYEKSNFKSKINQGRFEIENTFEYPQPFLIAWESEKNNIPFRYGFYFLDNNTNFIKIDSLYKKSVLDNPTQNEYKYKFLPFFLKNNFVMHSEILIIQDSEVFDFLLKKYVSENNNSYVALWFLINQFNTYGHKNIYKEISYNFSKKIKKSKPWLIFNSDISKIKIKPFEKFPELELKNKNLETTNVIIPKNKYVLIDFWFSRCKPCLEQVPALKEIFENNKDNFEIIGISTDRTENIEIWKKRIIEKEITWQNYLDENGVFSLSEKINTFPTNYLLDKNGYIIKKNIGLEELKIILKN